MPRTPKGRRHRGPPPRRRRKLSDRPRDFSPAWQQLRKLARIQLAQFVRRAVA